MSDDLIRRSDVIDILYREKRNALMQDHNSVARGIQASINCISNIPTIEPKRGEWVESGFEEIKCSVCGSAWDYCDNDYERFNFCPSCGAQMKGADDEAD